MRIAVSEKLFSSPVGDVIGSKVMQGLACRQ